MNARRAFLASAVAGLAAATLDARAQKPKPLRLGMLVSGLDRSGRAIDAFFQALREQGWVEKDNLVVVVRDVQGKAERFQALAAELVAQRPDVVLASSTPAARAMKQATSTIPILFVGDPDPVASGLVDSLARPGGNVTGISNLGNDIFGKRLEILRQAVPSARRVAYLWQRGAFPESVEAAMLRSTDADARAIGVQLVPVESRGAGDIDRAMADVAGARVDALVMHNPHPILFGERRRIAELAIGQRLPSIANVREFVVDGGLLSYGADFVASYRRAASYVGRIANGARPADLAVERATRLELCVNLGTAAAIGVAIPPALLTRADDVIR